MLLDYELRANFILAIGDDRTDEDLFRALPPTAHSVRVGLAQTGARYYLSSDTAVRRLLRQSVEGPGERHSEPTCLGLEAGGDDKGNSGSSRTMKVRAAWARMPNQACGTVREDCSNHVTPKRQL